MNSVVSVASLASAIAVASPAVASATCTLPPDLIERFVRMRTRFLKDECEARARVDEVQRRFQELTGLTDGERWWHFEHDDPRREELQAINDKIWAEVYAESGTSNEEQEAEIAWLGDERWAIAEVMLEHEPQTIVDLAWQAEAWLIADLEVLSGAGQCSSGRLVRKFFQYVRTLGAVLQPDDPMGLLTISLDNDEADEAA